MTELLGVGDRARDRAESLSLGNQQRVQLAAALVHRPEVLILDEPFSGLDPVGVDVLSAILRRQADDGAPVVFSSHQLELVERLCESVVMIDRGRIVASGRIADLRARDTRRLVRVEVAGAPDGWLERVRRHPRARAAARGRDRRARRCERVRRARRGARRRVGPATSASSGPACPRSSGGRSRDERSAPVADRRAARVRRARAGPRLPGLDRDHGAAARRRHRDLGGVQPPHELRPRRRGGGVRCPRAAGTRRGRRVGHRGHGARARGRGRGPAGGRRRRRRRRAGRRRSDRRARRAARPAGRADPGGVGPGAFSSGR